MNTEPETDDVHVLILAETEMAFRLQNSALEAAWFPKSVFHFKRRNLKTNEGIATIPLDVMERKGWTL